MLHFTIGLLAGGVYASLLWFYLAGGESRMAGPPPIPPPGRCPYCGRLG